MDKNHLLEQEIEFIDKRIGEEEAKIQQAKDLEVLFATEAFDRVILQAYMVGEADRITSAITMPDGMKREHIQTAMDKLVAIRHLRKFLANLELDSSFAVENIEDLKSTRIDIKANPEKYISTEEEE